MKFYKIYDAIYNSMDEENDNNLQKLLQSDSKPSIDNLLFALSSQVEINYGNLLHQIEDKNQKIGELFIDGDETIIKRLPSKLWEKRLFSSVLDNYLPTNPTNQQIKIYLSLLELGMPPTLIQLERIFSHVVAWPVTEIISFAPQWNNDTLLLQGLLITSPESIINIGKQMICTFGKFQATILFKVLKSKLKRENIRSEWIFPLLRLSVELCYNFPEISSVSIADILEKLQDEIYQVLEKIENRDSTLTSEDIKWIQRTILQMEELFSEFIEDRELIDEIFNFDIGKIQEALDYVLEEMRERTWCIII